MPYVISEPCVDIKDKACLEVCPVDCIHEGVRTLYIHPDECIDCHACEPVCPVEAIFPLEELPEEWSHYARINAEFFGLPPGADHADIAALPAESRSIHGQELAAGSVSSTT